MLAAHEATRGEQKNSNKAWGVLAHPLPASEEQGLGGDLGAALASSPPRTGPPRMPSGRLPLWALSHPHILYEPEPGGVETKHSSLTFAVPIKGL